MSNRVKNNIFLITVRKLDRKQSLYQSITHKKFTNSLVVKKYVAKYVFMDINKLSLSHY